jgi:hypothetical protein
MVYDNNKNASEFALLRIQRESMDGVHWIEKLYLLRKSVIDGSDYVVGYERQQ